MTGKAATSVQSAKMFGRKQRLADFTRQDIQQFVGCIFSCED